MKLGILKSFKELDPLVRSYQMACQDLGVNYVVLDLLSNDWINEIKTSEVDGILVRIKGNIQEQKSLFDERLYIINKELGIPVYPSQKELYIYENKRMLSYWLKVHDLPHVLTNVFYDKKSALKYLESASFPLVFKTNGGASASGVEIINSKLKSKFIAHKIFGFFDARLSFGHMHWGKIGILPLPKFGLTQKHYLIIQDFMKIKWEWRIIKIGNSYFGHQKLLKGKFASGSGLVGWVDPPRKLLLMVKKITELGKFDSIAVDIFENLNGDFFINEIQSLFGSFLPYQMKVNGVPGRYVYENDDFIFQPGEFNAFNSNLLRVQDFIEKIKNGYYKF